MYFLSAYPVLRPMPHSVLREEVTLTNQNPKRNSNSLVAESGTNLPVMAFVPWQSFENMYDPRTALKHGTAFKKLDKPFARMGDMPND